MGRKKKVDKVASWEPPVHHSFDIESIILMASLGYTIRKAIEDKAIEMAVDKKCIPRDTIYYAACELGLKDWLEQVKINYEEDNIIN
jgi:hypothetical protein